MAKSKAKSKNKKTSSASALIELQAIEASQKQRIREQDQQILTLKAQSTMLTKISILFQVYAHITRVVSACGFV